MHIPICHEKLFLSFNQIFYENAADTRICKLASFVAVVLYEILSLELELSTQVTWIHEI